MTDEMKIQQRPSAASYFIPGALVGGIGGAVAANHVDKVKGWVSEPAKYTSWEELNKAAKDTTEFSSAIEKAGAEEKPLMEKLAAAAKADEEALAKWDADLEAYKKANADGAIIPDENYNKLQQELEAKKQAVETKKSELVEKEAETLRKNNTGALTPEQKKVADTLNQKIQGVEAKKNAYISAREKALTDLNTKIAEARTSYTYTEFGKTVKAEGNAFEQLMQERKTFENTIESIESHLKDGKFKKGSELTFIDPKTKKVVTRVPKNAQEVKAAKQYFNSGFDKALTKMFPSIDKGILNEVVNEAMVVVENNVAINENVATKEDFLQKRVTAYKDALKDIPKEADVIADVRKNAAAGSAQEALINRFDANETEIKKLKNDITTLEKDIATIKDTNLLKQKNEELKNLKNKLNNRVANSNSMKESIRATFNMAQEAPLLAKKGELETKQLYKNIQRANELAAKEGGYTITHGGGLKGKVKRWLEIVTPNKLSPAEARELKNLQTLLTEAETNLGSVEFQKLEAAALKAGDVSADITRLEGEIKTLETTVTSRKEAQRTVNTFKKQIEEWAGKGATIDASGNIVKADGTIFKPEATVNLTSKVGAPANDPNIVKFDNTINRMKANIPQEGVLTETQILEKAKANITDDMLKAELEAQKAAQKALDEAAGKLPKAPAKTEAQLIEEFAKKNGARSEIENKTINSVKDDVAKLFEGKMSNKKLAGLVAGSAIVLGLAGLMLRPSAKEA